MSVLNVLLESVDKLKQNKNITIPVTPSMITSLMNHSDKLTEAKVRMKEKMIIISGKARVTKLFIDKEIPFTIVLKPKEMKNRNVIFEIIEVKPLNIRAINKQLFHKPPLLQYVENNIHIDFDAWDKVNRLPIGNINSFSIEKNTLLVKIGL